MRASIDIGSNSILLLVVDDVGAVVRDRATVVGLGKGLGERGLFKTDRMEAALGVLRGYVEEAVSLGIPADRVRGVATSASRRALNATTFYQNVKAQTGLRVEVISGEEEARLTWVGGVSGLDLPEGPVFLCDPGGGSTEVIMGEGKHVRFRTSLEIGTVRLTEQYLGYGVADMTALARLRAHVDAAVATVEIPTMPRVAVAVAGTATSLAAAELGLAAYSSEKVHGTSLSSAALRRWTDKLVGVTPERRRELLAVSPDRADTLLAGAVILTAILEKTRRHSWRISDRGLRYGVVGEA